MNYGKIWNGTFSATAQAQLRISLCTTVMNRLSDLQETLPINLAWEQYPNIEFVILDYNSRDGLGDWIKREYVELVESGRMVYARTEEPEFFSMTHSRNLAFKIASGDICINVDADNFLYDRAHPPDCTYGEFISRCAAEQPERAIFAKGKRMCRGRMGFYKKEFVELLGGYDEDITGYGHDEIDLMHRAWGLGFTLMYSGGRYIDRLRTSTEKRNANLKEHWKSSEKKNKLLSAQNLQNGKFKANTGRSWGQGKLMVNWSKEVLL